MALTLLGAAAASSVLMAQWNGVAAYVQQPVMPSCKYPDCTPIAIDQLHPREKKLLTMTSPSFYQSYFNKPENREEYLRLRKDDPRHKFLFLSAEYDDDYTDPERKFKFMKALNERFDFKFVVVNQFEKICEEIRQAAKTGKLAHVLIDAAGSPNRICLSINQGAAGWIYPDNEFAKCFEGLDLAGRVILLGANSGAPQNGNEIAQKIANRARRNVIAPIEYSAECVELVESNHFEIFHRSRKSLGIKNALKSIFFRSGDACVENNIFKLFNPIYKNCQSIPKDRVHPREKIVQDIVKDTHEEKPSYLIPPDELSNSRDALTFCQDDPGKKFLFLSMESDYNGALDPQLSPDLFKKIGEAYDFKFVVIDHYDKMCNEFKEAAKVGELAHVIINGHGSFEDIHISGDESNPNNDIHLGRDLAKCMNGLMPAGKVTLISCDTGLSTNKNPDGSFAKSVAKAIQRKVIAPKGKSAAVLIEVPSVAPFKIWHPSKIDAKENLYKTFKP